MMDFWPENQGHLPQYTKFGTIPGRNCTQNYHDRHQATHYPLYYGEQQDQGRESSYWTVPGSRTGGSLQEYTNWADPELSAPTSSHFPFILDRHAQQHQDLGEYQHQEARDREWTAIQRAAREYERGMLREGWQRRWEPVSPVRYNREVSKRNDSSYRELEAWAARYSHSLPRRRRIEAELRGASQGLLDKTRVPERDSRSGTDPRVAALQQMRQSTNIRESGLWDRGTRQQAPNYYPSPAPAPAPETSHTLDIKEKTSYQRRMFSQPPGYIAPPPYNTPQKSMPTMHQYDASWEQELKRQTYQSQHAKQDIAHEMHDMRMAEKESFTKPELEVCRQRKEPGASSGPISIQNTHMQPECMFSLQQAIPEAPNTKINEATSSKVIEGRKFRLNKKTGGMTIFCLVSRIAGTETETPSLPLCTSQTNIHSTEVGEVSKSQQDSSNISQTLKLADEVDFRAQAQTSVQPSAVQSPQVKQKGAPICLKSESLGEDLSNKADTDIVSQQKTNEADSTLGKQAAQSFLPLSVKYPLWREPSFTSRAETDTSCLKGHSDGLPKQEDSAKVSSRPNDVEGGKQDTEKATESEDSNDMLLIDTTCVVVKMELIPSPKKEHVHYLSSDEQSPSDTQSNVSPVSAQLNQDITPDQNNETTTESNPLTIDECAESEINSDLVEKKAPEEESEISFPSIPSSLVSEKETLEERAERILGITLDDCIAEEQPGDETTGSDSSAKSQEEAEAPSIENNDINEATEQIPQDTTEKEESQNHSALDQSNDATDQVMSECEGVFAEPQDQVTSVSTENETECHPEAEIQTLQEIEMTEDPLCESNSEEITSENGNDENQLVENDDSSCLSPPTDTSSSFSPSTDCKEPDSTPSDLPGPPHISESNTQECPDPLLSGIASATNLESSHPETPSPPHTPSQQQVPSPLPPESAEYIPSLSVHADEPLSVLPLSFTDPTAEALTGDDMRVEDQDQDGQITQLVNNGIVNVEPLIKDMTEQLESQQQIEPGTADDAPRVKESDVTDEQQMKEDNELPNAIEVDDLQEQFEYGQTEDAPCVKESLMTEEQSKEGDQTAELPKEDATDCQTQIETEKLEQKFVQSEEADFVNETNSAVEGLHEEADKEPSDTEQTDFKEKDCETKIETETLPQQFEFVQGEEAAFVNETDTSEEGLREEADKNPSDILEHTDYKENEIDPESPKPSSPSKSDYEVSQSPLDVLSLSQVTSTPQATHKSDTEFVLETASVGSSALNPDTAADDMPETVPPHLHQDSCEQPLQFSSSSPSDSPPVLLSNSAPPPPPPQEICESLSLESPLSAEQKEKPQYPKSLLDAVNRIRKHTAPDSENEEEEVTDMWDPDSAAEDVIDPDVAADVNSVDILSYCTEGLQERKKLKCDGAVQQVVSSVEEVQQSEQDPGHEEPSGHVEEDTLSCSSNSSHESEDTVIVADEDEAEEPEDVAESKTDSDGECHKPEEEQCCSGEGKEEAAAEEEEDDDDDGDKRNKNESSRSEERPGEGEKLTAEASETTETEQKGNEEVLVCTGAADEVNG